MAIYHCSVKTVSRAKGGSAVASAAYRSGEKLIDHTTGEVKDYTRKSGVLATGLVFPNEFEPILIREIDREKLWNLAEINEKRKNSTVAREIEVALPNELNERDRETLVEAYCKALANVHKVAVDYAIHAPSRHGDERNYHAHILMTTRRINEQGELGAKTREWDDKVQGVETVKFWRQRWEDFTNKTLEINGIDERIDSRSLKEQGITDRQPTTHKGVARTAMERKGVEFPSEPTVEPIFEPRFEERAEIDQHAQSIDELKQEIEVNQALKAQAVIQEAKERAEEKARQAEEQRRAEEEKLTPQERLQKAQQAVDDANWERAKDPNNAAKILAYQDALRKQEALTEELQPQIEQANELERIRQETIQRNEERTKHQIDSVLKSNDIYLRCSILDAPEMRTEWLQSIAEKHKCEITVRKARRILSEKANGTFTPSKDSIAQKIIQRRDFLNDPFTIANTIQAVQKKIWELNGAEYDLKQQPEMQDFSPAKIKEKMKIESDYHFEKKDAYEKANGYLAWGKKTLGLFALKLNNYKEHGEKVDKLFDEMQKAGKEYHRLKGILPEWEKKHKETQAKIDAINKLRTPLEQDKAFLIQEINKPHNLEKLQKDFDERALKGEYDSKKIHSMNEHGIRIDSNRTWGVYQEYRRSQPDYEPPSRSRDNDRGMSR